jgi:hypothetical protein
MERALKGRPWPGEEAHRWRNRFEVFGREGERVSAEELEAEVQELESSHEQWHETGTNYDCFTPQIAVGKTARLRRSC